VKSILSSVLMLAATAATASEPTNALPADAQLALHSTGSHIIYSLEPSPDPHREPGKALGKLQRVDILGQSELSDAQRKVAVDAFDAAIAGWDGLVAACFEPRHALRVPFKGSQYDFLLCYTCNQMWVYRDGQRIGSVGVTGSPDVLNRLMASLQLPLSDSLERWDKAQEGERARSQAGLKRFLAAMPASIRPFWEADSDFQAGMTPYGQKLDELRAAFVSAHPDRDAAVRTLLTWFGSGSGRWSGFPGFEALPEELLLDYPTADIVQAAQAPDASEALLEGAARYLAGWPFSRRHPQDLPLVPASLKQRLLDHTMRTGDANEEDRQQRARRAFH
jgi:hypothetical protein